MKAYKFDKDEIKNEKIRKLEEEIQKLLQERPELAKLQEEIEKILDDIGDDSIKRMATINEILVKHVREKLIPALEEVGESNKKAEKVAQYAFFSKPETDTKQ